MAEFTLYESVAAFVDAAEAHAPSDYTSQRGDDWNGGVSWAEACALARSGDASAVDAANAILEQVDASILASAARPQWSGAVCGAYANVPAYLAGAPETMMALRNLRGPRREVNIYYSPVASANISADEIFRRGVTVLALAMQLGRVREVNLHFVTCYGRGSDHIIRLSSPLVVAEAAHVLTSTSFLRQLSYGLAKGSGRGWDGKWAEWYLPGSLDANIAQYRKRLRLSDEDIVIPPMHKREWDRGDMADPAAYINRMLSCYH